MTAGRQQAPQALQKFVPMLLIKTQNDRRIARLG
jgi:hypothetical protein